MSEFEMAATIAAKDIPVSVQAIFRRAWSGGSRADAVNAMCLECQGFVKRSVIDCDCFDCPIWPCRPYRNHIAALESRARRRASKRASRRPVPISYDAIFERDGGVCHLCLRPVSRGEVEFDHVIPLSRGGEHVSENIRPAHSFCNRSKHDRLVESGAFAARPSGQKRSFRASVEKETA